jgi:hypothetical protein
MQSDGQQRDERERRFIPPFLFGLAALCLCAIPFVRPVTPLVWPLILISLFLVCRGIILGIPRSGWLLVASSLTLAMDFLAAYLVITGKHLIKWLGL